MSLPDRLTPDQLGQLAEEPTREEVSYRKGAGGRELTYLEGWAVIDSMNRIFGPDGWGHRVHNDFRVVQEFENGEQVIAVTVSVFVYLDGRTVEHTDIGIGTVRKPTKDHLKMEHFEMAYKEVATDGLKRAARALGNRLGNSLYDKGHELHKGNSGKGSSRSSSGSRSTTARSTGSSTHRSKRPSTGGGSTRSTGSVASTYDPSPDDAPPFNAGDHYECEICGKPLEDSKENPPRHSAAQYAAFSHRIDGRITHARCRMNEQQGS